MILTRERRAKHPFAGGNTQQLITGEGQRVHEVLVRGGRGDSTQMDNSLQSRSNRTAACGKLQPGGTLLFKFTNL